MKNPKKVAWLISQSVDGTLKDGRFRTNPKCYAWKSHPGSLTVWFKRGGGFACYADQFVPNILALSGKGRDIHRIIFNY